MSEVNLKEIYAGIQPEMLGKLHVGAMSFVHPGTMGDNSEANWIEWFKNYLPKRYKVAKGIIIDSAGNQNHQIDLVIYDAHTKDPLAEIYTHDTGLKKRLLAYAANYPDMCQMTDNDEQGGLRFETNRSRVSIRLMASYSDSRKEKLAREAKAENLRKGRTIANE